MASSQKRIDANRENARRSTGPQTQAGKDQARRNGMTHGLTSTALLLDDESPEEYQALVDATLADLAPRSERERVLAIQVADALWRRQRLYRAEAAFINVRTRALKAENPHIRNSAEATAMLLTEPTDANRLRLLLRYITAAERACNRAVADFYAVRNEVRKEQAREQNDAEAGIAATARAALAELDALEARDRARFANVFAGIPATADDGGEEDDTQWEMPPDPTAGRTSSANTTEAHQ
ncbi:MAG: hypothetical protein SGI92_32260 [Bryobacteraceae bacterium]|nr:hypothetical protein [Bryobacteraceae bacterium]